jgi:hypothetical protein
MTTYIYSKARQNFTAVLDKAKKEGKVLIKKRDNSSFILSTLPLAESPSTRGVTFARDIYAIIANNPEYSGLF